MKKSRLELSSSDGLVAKGFGVQADNLRSGPSTQLKKLGVVVYICNLRVEETEAGGFLGLSGQPAEPASWAPG